MLKIRTARFYGTISTRLHGITSDNTIVFIVESVKYMHMNSKQSIKKSDTAQDRLPYPRHYDPFNVSENVLPLFRFLRCLPRDQFLQVAGLHGGQHGSETLYRVF